MNSLKSFRVQVMARITLFLAFAFSAFYFGWYTPFSLMVFWMVLFAVLVLVDFIRFVERSERDLRNFLLAIKQNDFSNIYPERDEKTKTLYHAFNVITSEFTRLRSEKETNYHFFKTVVEHIKVPLLAYDWEGERVTLINEAAKELFHIPYLSKLESLTLVDPKLLETSRNLESDRKVLLKLRIKDEDLHLSVVAKTMVLQEKKFKVIAFYNLKNELDQQEIESWQKLIRVLTHEIKNSVIPISTLTEVINQMLTDSSGEEVPLKALDAEDEEDLRIGLRTMEKRSKSLVKFVNSYGDLARMPKPELESCDLVDLVERVLDLETAELKKAGIDVKKTFPSKVALQIDPGAIEQVLINLLKNAIEALDQTQKPEISLDISTSHDHVVLQIQDNGPGIDEQMLSNIFVPFFTTKKTGSGIGLPLSRQVMKAHGGSIKVNSRIGEGTHFDLKFNV